VRAVLLKQAVLILFFQLLHLLVVGEAVIVLRLVPRVVRAEVVVLKVVLLVLVTQVVTHPLKVTLVDLKVETIILVVVVVLVLLP
jgi:hypothetical protein